MMNAFENWFVKRTMAKDVVQGCDHVRKIEALYALIREVCEEEFTEDNAPTMDAFLRERFEATQYAPTASRLPAPDAMKAVFATVKIPLGELEKQAEYDLGWEDCSRHHEKEIKRLRDVLQRIANGDPQGGEYVLLTLDEAMARAAQDALSKV